MASVPGDSDSTAEAIAKEWLDVTVAIEVVTPALAQEWLGRREGQRNIQDQRVKTIGQLMFAYRWYPSWDAIAFDVHGNCIAAVLKGLAHFERTWEPIVHTSSGRDFSPEEALSVLQRWPEARDHSGAVKVPGLAPSQVNLLWLLFAYVDVERAAEFWHHVKTGANLDEGDPCLALRLSETT